MLMEVPVFTGIGIAPLRNVGDLLVIRDTVNQGQAVTAEQPDLLSGLLQAEVRMQRSLHRIAVGQDQQIPPWLDRGFPRGVVGNLPFHRFFQVVGEVHAADVNRLILLVDYLDPVVSEILTRSLPQFAAGAPPATPTLRLTLNSTGHELIDL